MNANELLEDWDRGNRLLVVDMIIHDAHPNIVIDFANLLFSKRGERAVEMLKDLINDEYSRYTRGDDD